MVAVIVTASAQPEGFTVELNAAVVEAMVTCCDTEGEVLAEVLGLPP
jgi:hypothetical protein